MAKTKARSKKAPPFIGCTLKQLTPKQKLAFAADAHRLNPLNVPSARGVAMAQLKPAMIAELTTAYWGKEGARKITVAFIDNPSQAFRTKLFKYANKWGQDGAAAIEFVETKTDPMVRLDRGPGGYWSYLGVEILQIPPGQPTMNLERFTEATPDSEWDRVVCHEFGHTLGFPHEHMRRAIVQRLDPNATIVYFRQNQGWPRSVTIAQVLTPVEESELLQVVGFEVADEESIMAYQLPPQITKDHKPIVGGLVINAKDAAFARTIYPGSVVAPPPGPGGLPDTFSGLCDIGGSKFTVDFIRQ